MTDNNTTVKKHRTMTFDSLRVHCSKLDLEKKVQLRNELTEQVTAEVNRLKQMADAAAEFLKPS